MSGEHKKEMNSYLDLEDRQSRVKMRKKQYKQKNRIRDKVIEIDNGNTEINRIIIKEGKL